jgi:MFS family permease
MFSNTLEGNIIKYNVYKIFTKRVFLPLIAVYLTTIGNVTLAQLGIIASITAIVSLVMEIPAGYIADRVGHKTALIITGFMTSISPLFYIFMPNFTGGILASVVFFSGYAFTSGTIQAFMQETLLSLGRESEYVKIMGRAQSYGLLGNVILVSLIPLTYTINPILPFVLGFICLFIAFLIVLSFQKPRAHVQVTHAQSSFFREVKNILSKKLIIKMVLMFLIFGITSAAFDNSVMYRELVFKDFGIPVNYFGFILAFGSFLAAITGNYIHHLKKLKFTAFYLFDASYIIVMLSIIGLSKNVVLSVLAFSMLPAYDRTRNIIFESQVFEQFPRSNYKSTLLSIMNFFSLGNAIWTPLVFGFFVASLGIASGYIAFAGILLIILIPILLGYSLINRS